MPDVVQAPHDVDPDAGAAAAPWSAPGRVVSEGQRPDNGGRSVQHPLQAPGGGS